MKKYYASIWLNTISMVLWCTELVSFQQTKDFVTVRLIRRNNGEESEETVTAEWLIGTEGARSKWDPSSEIR